MNTDTITSGENLSYWIDSVHPLAFDTLTEDLTTDVLVIGAGIAGLTTAYNLASTGRQVVLVEDGLIGSGESGRTTAHLTHALDDRYSLLEKIFSDETIRLAAESHTAAIDWIENTVQREMIDCDFRRVNGYLFLHPSDEPESLDKEREASHRAGLHTTMLETTPGIPGAGRCLQYPRQGQFHIMKYLRGLAEAFTMMGGRIFTQAHATKISKEGARVNEFFIKAMNIVVATNTPVNDIVTIHTKQVPYRTYVIGVTIPKGQLEPALWWDTGDQDSKWFTHPYHYTRLQPYNEHFDLLIAGGEDHKTGQADTEDIAEEDRYTNLIQWTRQKFPAAKEIIYRWSGQVMEPFDSLAYIGRNPGDENIFIITGDSGNGMTHGTIGGMVITDLINGKENPWAEIYKPTRIPLKSAGKYIKEALNNAMQYADWIAKEEIESADQLGNGEGAIISSGMKKFAVYKDERGELHVFSAKCTHLGCVVQWNADEKSFDCPCHGSRYSSEGKVINGPAIADLKMVEVKDAIEH
jgi:glycine/D-amino acid oxidase-like deaminating enzyme/nitrite reductase/ring-hydroxylating ferredoxin subunit